nr:1,2-phenylacetyl-CoA epoxidase subunit PaaD [Spiractinospora alimapuensis]
MTSLEIARAVAEEVTDPELPMVTLADLGVLRGVGEESGTVVVTITPTYSGCPAIDAMRDDLERALRGAGVSDLEIRTALDPAWTSDWITARGRRRLAESGIAPPDPAPVHTSGPIPLRLRPTVRVVPCPRCGSRDTEELSPFSATACKALRRCRTCAEPFEKFKEL